MAGVSIKNRGGMGYPVASGQGWGVGTTNNMRDLLTVYIVFGLVFNSLGFKLDSDHNQDHDHDHAHDHDHTHGEHHSHHEIREGKSEDINSDLLRSEPIDFSRCDILNIFNI